MRPMTTATRPLLTFSMPLLAVAALTFMACPISAQETLPLEQPAVEAPESSVPTADDEATPVVEAVPVDETAPVDSVPDAPAVVPADTDAPMTDIDAPALDATDSADAVPPLPNVPTGTLPHDLSPWGMFMQADWIVKGVMIGLAFASLVTWTVWLAKGLELMGAGNRARGALKAITRSKTLDDAIRALEGRRGAGVLLVKAAEEEVQLSIGALDYVDGTGLKERVSSRLSRLTAAAGRRLSRGTGLLATIGSTAPFVGLFGTVWGIMNAFIGISEAQTTNLAVVAPGIAEALLATALGLVAAIPAVVIYNVFARSVTGYRQVLVDAASGVERLVSRDLDYRTVPVQPSLRTAGQNRTDPQPPRFAKLAVDDVDPELGGEPR